MAARTTHIGCSGVTQGGKVTALNAAVDAVANTTSSTTEMLCDNFVVIEVVVTDDATWAATYVAIVRAIEAAGFEFVFSSGTL